MMLIVDENHYERYLCSWLDYKLRNHYTNIYKNSIPRKYKTRKKVLQTLLNKAMMVIVDENHY